MASGDGERGRSGRLLRKPLGSHEKHPCGDVSVIPAAPHSMV
jgi:hypothetical protein